MMYKKSFIGMGWLLISPIMGIVSWLFMNAAGVLEPGELDIPYPAYVLISSSIFGLFMNFFTGASNTINVAKGFILQVNFPHDAMLIKQSLQQLANFVISFGVAIIILISFGIFPDWRIVFLPLFILPIFFIASSLGIIVSVITVVTPDLQKGISFLMSLLIYVTPIIYAPKVSNPMIQKIIDYNPLTYVIGGARDFVLFGHTENMSFLPNSFICKCVCFYACYALVLYFRRKSNRKNNIMSDAIIKVENLSKKFCRTLKRSMAYGTIDTARSMFSIPYKTDSLRKDEFWALKNISFELKKGEKLGIIGANGSGKTTLLRLLNGIFPPDEGRISVNGRIGALIAVGAGIHPHMTGRENIYLNGTILGMPKEEIKEKFDQIVEFTELHEFLDAPVSTYSSGMKVKLGFAIAVHSQADILLVDEVLSVGDIGFRNKSLRFMGEKLNKANGLIYISHNLDQVQYLCDRILVLDKGQIVFNGKPNDAIRQYERLQFVEKKATQKYHHGYSMNKGVRVLQVFINDQKAIADNAKILQNKAHEIKIEVEFETDFEDSTPAIGISDEFGHTLWTLYGYEIGLNQTNYKKGNYRFIMNIPPIFLREGKYYVNFIFRNIKSFETYERHMNAGVFYSIGTKKQAKNRDYSYSSLIMFYRTN